MAARGTQQAKAKPAAKQTAPKRAAKRARAPKPVAPFTPSFAAQRDHASAKELLLFELQRARVAVNAALQGVPGGVAERPVRPGGWSIREVVLHLAVRDRVRLEEFDAALAGQPASWVGVEHDAMASLNEQHLEPIRSLSFDEAVRLLHTTRARLLERLTSVPAEPAQVWTEQHPFGAMLRMLPPHDRNHAEQIKHARMQG